MGEAACHVHLLPQAADPDKRTVALAYTAHLQAGLGAKASLCQQRHEFVTQELTYELGNGSEPAAAPQQQPAASPAEDGAAVAAAAAAATAAAAAGGDLAQAEQAAENLALALQV